MTATIERIDVGPFRPYTEVKTKVYAIIFHTSQGRELFDQYDTKAQARKDAAAYEIKLSN